MNNEQQQLTRKDFLSGTEPKWCPGCGCNVVLNRLTGTFPLLGIPKEKFVMVSGIGCSSRFPYYLNTYGFHGIHGRAAPVASGLKLHNPDLSVWVATGDGDGLAIGGNHFIHLMRRNVDIKVVLFNNQIYGLTKGQASPTTQVGVKTKTTPFGSEEIPMRPLPLAIASGATFAARISDSDPDLISEVLLAAGKHKGIAFIEVMINCIIFNDGAFKALTDINVRAENIIRLKHGEPLIYGTNKDKGVKLNGVRPESFKLGAGGNADSALVHDIHNPDSTPAYLLASMEHPSSPVPFGIFRQVSKPVYGDRTMPAPSDTEVEKLMMSGGNSWQLDDSGNIGTVDP
ncbi:MAG: 2-oxoacid:ferredoxin oxidoreductase subunit beta [Bdellovibrionales bacterium RIFOXYD1_FULL_53_11]|nr:MAG: 2-oxoacid:ferredoxin oxidoreductase subunit beta [Bdellovibrionales bacterium RIFOXYD1_FULL_53_11]